MAYNRKNTTKKSTTKKTSETPKKQEVVEEIISDEEVFSDVEIEDVDDVPAPKAEKRVFHADDMILCRSVAAGLTCMEGRTTNMVYIFRDYGDECGIEYRDLAAAVRFHSDFIYKPYFIVEDQDFVDEFAELKKFYTEKFTVKELTDIINMNEGDMESAIEVLPKGAKEQLVNIVSTKIVNGELDSIRKIKTLQKLLDVDFSFVAEI
jgi:hypothetical protein